MTVKKVLQWCANWNLMTLMFKSKLQWEMTMWRHGVRIFWTSLSKWPHHLSGSASAFLQRESKEDCRKGGVVDPHWFQYGSGSSILGQCGSVSGSRDLMAKHFTINKKIFLSKTASLGIYEGRPPSYRRSFQPFQGDHPELQKQYISSLPPPFLGHFCLPGSGSGSSRSKSMRIRIPQHWGKVVSFYLLFHRLADIWLLYGYICQIFTVTFGP